MTRRVRDSLSELGTQMTRWLELVLKKMSLRHLALCVASAAGALKNVSNHCSEKRLTILDTTDNHLMKSLTRCKKEIKALQNALDGAHGS